ncbi:HEAT repeat domain-containing protein [Haloferula sp. BvORR071]|uniref:HEAT repeat domain-containing protein n=1 Tax=Haloferula sp. BvORR071 TaxID=1396141 RepID=UPI0006984B06|nr:HEAT repeat domain-containing protein [Haloferula sp. BvORR071]
MSTNDSQTGGTVGYRGYDYQILVTVWLALKLMVQSRNCVSIEVEPASSEDVEAHLDTDPDEATSTVGAQLGLKRLDVQVKWKSDQWTASSFKGVLRIDSNSTLSNVENSGKRPSPLARLEENTESQFLFVTNAQMGAQVARFDITEIGQLSAATLVPDEPAAYSVSLVQRIGALSQMTPERLKLEIKEVLSQHGHVPPSRLEACLEDLGREVRRRLLRQIGAAWTLESLKATLVRFGGFPPPIEGFIPPENFDLIDAKLAAGAVLVQGSPGTGKTFIGELLQHRHRTDSHPFEIHNADDGYHAIRTALGAPGRHLFVFDDPWGHYQLEEKAKLWAGELPKLLHDASPEKRFLIVSRTTMLNSAYTTKIPDILTNIAVDLSVTDYRAEARREILKEYTRAGASWQRELVEREGDKIVSALGEPLALKTFAHSLLRLKQSDTNVSRLIEQSKVVAIAEVFAQEIIGREKSGIASGVLLWTLLMTRGRITPELVEQAGDEVILGGYKDECDPIELFNWLRKSGRLSMVDKQYSLHPSLLQGLESLLEHDSSIPKKIITARLTALAEKGEAGEIEAIAKLIRLRQLRPPAAAQNILNSSFLERVLSDHPGWRHAFSDLVRFSTATDPVTLILKLLAPVAPTDFPGVEEWTAPSVDEATISAIAASPQARDCAKLFVSEYLTELSHCYIKADELCEFFGRFKWDFSDVFQASLVDSLKYGREIELDLFIPAALRGPEPHYDELISAALDGIPRESEPSENDIELTRQADQEEIDAAWAARILEPDERGWHASNALHLLVSRRREAEGYQWIVEHPACERLHWAWHAAIEPSAPLDEIIALRDLCKSADPRPFWRALSLSPNPSRAALLCEYFKSAPVEHLGDLICALEKLVSEKGVAGYFRDSLSELSLFRKLEILEAVLDEKRWQDPDTSPGLGLFADDQLPGVKCCIRSARSGSEARPEDLAPLERSFVELVATTGPDHLALAALSLLQLEEPAAACALARLQGSSNWRIRNNAGSLIYRAGQPGWRHEILKLLDDTDYRCRKNAISALASKASPDEKKRILSKSTDKSGPVREACAQAIGNQKWDDAAEVLLGLCKDPQNYDDSAHMSAHSSHFKVARTAATSLGQLGTLDESTLAKALTLAADLCGKPAEGEEKDIGVAHDLLLSLSEQSPAITSFYLAQLSNPWYGHAFRKSGFTIRMAAAWGLFGQLLSFPEQRAEIAPEKLREGSMSPDHRLAGPCLASLCLLGCLASEALIFAAQQPEFDENRALLVKCFSAEISEEVVKQVNLKLPPDGQGTLLLEWLLKNDSPSKRSFDEFLSAHADVVAWISGLAKKAESAELRSVLASRWPELLEGCLDIADLPTLHYPEHIPTLRLR